VHGPDDRRDALKLRLVGGYCGVKVGQNLQGYFIVEACRG
jgi:hypothetical protein